MSLNNVIYLSVSQHGFSFHEDFQFNMHDALDWELVGLPKISSAYAPRIS